MPFHLLTINCSARYSRNKTRFVSLPSQLDCNSSNTFMLDAALTAGLYPKILAIDNTTGQMKTITNNQPASFHPSSVNFKRKPTTFGVQHLSYFTLMCFSSDAKKNYILTSNRHSKKLYAWETGPVDDVAMFLLCGECDFRVTTRNLSYGPV